MIAIKREYTGDKIKKLKKNMMLEVETYFISEKINNNLLNSIELVINELKQTELKEVFKKELAKRDNIILISNILYNLNLNNFK